MTPEEHPYYIAIQMFVEMLNEIGTDITEIELDESTAIDTLKKNGYKRLTSMTVDESKIHKIAILAKVKGFDNKGEVLISMLTERIINRLKSSNDPKERNAAKDMAQIAITSEGIYIITLQTILQQQFEQKGFDEKEACYVPPLKWN